MLLHVLDLKVLSLFHVDAQILILIAFTNWVYSYFGFQLAISGLKI